MKLKYSYILSGLMMMITACSSTGNKQTVKETVVETKKAEAPVFNQDSALYFVEKQMSFGNRIPNTKEHLETAEWLAEKLKSYGADVTVQNAAVTAYDNTILNAKNIIGSFNPENPNRVLLYAHWDSRPYADHDPNPANHTKPVPGANDGASGVGVLMEMARLFSQQAPEVGVDIIFFDAEDYGTPEFYKGPEKKDTWALGSQYWSRRPHKPGYKAKYGILLDMVGAPGARFAKEGISKYYANFVLDKVWGAANDAGYGDYFVNEDGGYITDDHYYVNKIAGIPSIDIIDLYPDTESGFYPYWHTVNDTFDKIDKNTLKAVGQTVTNVVYSEK